MSDETTIPPALTPEEWAHPDMYVERDGFYVYAPRGIIGPVVGATDSSGGVGLGQIQHAVAALCLYGQPFGFTQEDVALLRAAVIYEPYGFCDEPRDIDADATERLARVTAKVAALLPAPK